MFIVVGFVGSEFGIFVGFGWVRSSDLVGKLGFGRVRSSTTRVRSSSEFVTFGFDPTLVVTYRMHSKTKLIFRKIEKPLHYHPKIFSVERKNIVFQYEFFFCFCVNKK